MRHFINIFVLLILVFFAIGISYLQHCDEQSLWAMLYGPWIGFAIAWGIRLNKQY